MNEMKGEGKLLIRTWSIKMLRFPSGLLVCMYDWGTIGKALLPSHAAGIQVTERGL